MAELISLVFVVAVLAAALLRFTPLRRSKAGADLLNYLESIILRLPLDGMPEGGVHEKTGSEGGNRPTEPPARRRRVATVVAESAWREGYTLYAWCGWIRCGRLMVERGGTSHYPVRDLAPREMEEMADLSAISHAIIAAIDAAGLGRGDVLHVRTRSERTVALLSDPTSALTLGRVERTMVFRATARASGEGIRLDVQLLGSSGSVAASDAAKATAFALFEAAF